MTASTTAVPASDLAVVAATACRRVGPGRGCITVRWHHCTACGWTGHPWDGDQPPMTDWAHRCDPAAVGRRRQLLGDR